MDYELELIEKVLISYEKVFFANKGLFSENFIKMDLKLRKLLDNYNIRFDKPNDNLFNKCKKYDEYVNEWCDQIANIYLPYLKIFDKEHPFIPRFEQCLEHAETIHCLIKNCKIENQFT